MTKYILGVDGGGTKTRAAIINVQGQLVGVGVGGPSNYDDVGPEIAQGNIDNTVTAAWDQAGMPPQAFAAAFLGMAGVVSPTDRQIIHQIAMNLKLAAPDKIGVDHDCRAALAGGLAGRPGIVLIAGTGSSCYGINAKGDSWRAGGWGELISDEGSSYRLGVQAMIMAVRAYDGRAETTVLLERVLECLGLGHINEIMHHLYSKGMTRAEIAQLAPMVIDAAQSGDNVAQQLIQQAVDELAECVLAVAQRLELGEACELVLVGGLMSATETFVAPLMEAVTRRLPACKIQYPELPPELGACLLGLKLLEISLTPDVIDALHSSADQIKRDQ